MTNRNDLVRTTCIESKENSNTIKYATLTCGGGGGMFGGTGGAN